MRVPLSLFPHVAVAVKEQFIHPFGLTVLKLLIDFTTSGARTVKKTSDEYSRILPLDASLVPLGLSFDVARSGCCLGWMIATLHAAVLTVLRQDRCGQPRRCKDGRRDECNLET